MKKLPSSVHLIFTSKNGIFEKIIVAKNGRIELIESDELCSNHYLKSNFFFFQKKKVFIIIAINYQK